MLFRFSLLALSRPLILSGLSSFSSIHFSKRIKIKTQIAQNGMYRRTEKTMMSTFLQLKKLRAIVADYHNDAPHTRLKRSQALEQTKVMCGKSNFKRCRKETISEWSKQDRVTCAEQKRLGKKDEKQIGRQVLSQASICKHVSERFFLVVDVGPKREKETGEPIECLRRTCLKLNCGSEIKTQYYILLNYEYFVPTPY